MIRSRLMGAFAIALGTVSGAAVVACTASPDAATPTKMLSISTPVAKPSASASAATLSGPEAPSTAVTSRPVVGASGSGRLLPTHSIRADAAERSVMLAVISGTLRDEGRCIILADDGNARVGLVWPGDYRVSTSGAREYVSNEAGSVVATVGGLFAGTGGYISDPEVLAQPCVGTGAFRIDDPSIQTAPSR